MKKYSLICKETGITHVKSLGQREAQEMAEYHNNNYGYEMFAAVKEEK